MQRACCVLPAAVVPYAADSWVVVDWRFDLLRFFDADLMTMRVERVRGNVALERLIAALNSAWISA